MCWCVHLLQTFFYFGVAVSALSLCGGIPLSVPGVISCSEQVGSAANHSTVHRLHKRQTSSDSIGHTATLSGDNHNQAVVHWTGYPSEHLFIVTRDRESNDPYSHSRESWLWRWVCPSLTIPYYLSILCVLSCRSTDYGHHFNKETYKLNSSNVVIEWYYISPRQSNVSYVHLTATSSYVIISHTPSHSLPIHTADLCGQDTPTSLHHY